MLHRGRTVRGVERLTLSASWSLWNGNSVPPPRTIDGTLLWKLDPAVRDGLPSRWMQSSWDKWLVTQYSPAQIVERYPGLLPVHAAHHSDSGATQEVAVRRWQEVRRPPALQSKY